MDTRHPDEGTIYAYVERQLPLAEQARVEAHVSSCAECAAFVAEARGLIAAASRIVGALDDVPAKVIPARPARRLPPWLAAAAVMVLAVGVSSVAVRSGLESRREAATMTADAAGEPQREVAAESQASPMAASVVPERGAVRSNTTVATGAAPVTRGGPAELRSSTVAAAPEPIRKAGAREESVALAAPRVSAPPVPPPAASDFSGAGARATVGGAAGAAVPTGRTAARMQAAAPGDAAALSLRQSEVTITGRVMAEDGEPLANANVFINSLTISVRTDANGRYAIVVPSSQAQGESVVIRARAFGYSTESQQMTLRPGEQATDFELRAVTLELSEVGVATAEAAVSELRELPIADASGAKADSISARNAEARALRHQVETQSPMRTVRYEALRGVIIELREFHAAVRVPSAQPGVNEYRWGNSAGTRRYVLSGPLTVAELERLASRLGELRVIR